MIGFKYPEGATPIDPDETEGLLLTHITTHGELNRWELGISTLELSKRLGISQPTASQSVKRGEKILKEREIKLRV